MKPIIEKENQDAILTSEITNNHIVVGIINDEPKILIRENFDEGEFYFRAIRSELINGNGCMGHATIKDGVNHKIGDGHKIEVFKEEDWKKALQWLIDNA